MSTAPAYAFDRPAKLHRPPHNQAEMLRAISLLVHDGSNHELRGLPDAWSRIILGGDTLGQQMALDDLRDCESIHLSLNPVKATLGDKAASSADIVRREHILVDVDPVKGDPNGSATDKEKSAAIALAGKIVNHLLSLGWPEPLISDSGNGWHVNFRVDLPNDSESDGLVKRFLKVLAAQFDTPEAKVDTGVGSAAKLAKLSGSWARKGPNTPNRPHRESAIMFEPEAINVVPVELIQSLAGPAPEPRRPAVPVSTIPFPTASSRVDSYASSALDGELSAVATAASGGRNNQLNASAYALGQLVAAGTLDRGEVERQLLDAAVSNGLAEFDAAKTIRSGLDAGLLKPRELPETVVNPTTRSKPSSNASAPVVDTDTDADEIEVVDRWPKANPAMFHGPMGEFVQAIAPETEADPVATLIQGLAGFGNMIGRGAHFQVSSTKHYTIINSVIVGATAVGRKGTSGDDAEFGLGTVDPDWAEHCCRNGLTTGEGLISLVRDPKHRNPTSEEVRKGHPRDELILVDEGVQEKRLHVVETEFAKVLKSGARDANTLSETIRQIYDGKRKIGNLSKHNGASATDAHVSIVGHITKADIRKCMSEADTLNGFGNRFLWVAARRSKELPDGGEMYSLDLNDVLDKMRRAREFAVGLGDHRMTFDDEFRRVWRDIYSELSSDQRHVMAARSEANCKRLAMIYALLDQTAVVGVEHLMAALAVLDYVNQTIAYVFGSAVSDPSEAKLIEALKAAPDGLTRKQINHDVFGRHLKKDAITSVLSALLTRGVIHSKAESNGRGRPAERWFLGRASTQPQPSQN